MPKRIALKDSVTVNSIDLSNFCSSWGLTSEHAREDVSGFNATGSSEYLAGITTQSVTATFYDAYGTGEPHTVLYPIHKNRTIVPLAIRPDQTTAVSATNPELRGNVQVLSFNPGVTRGDVDSFDVEFTAADAAGLAFFTS